MNALVYNTDEFLIIENNTTLVKIKKNEKTILYESQEYLELIEIIDSKYVLLEIENNPYVYNMETNEIIQTIKSSIGSKEISLENLSVRDIFTGEHNEIFISTEDSIFRSLSNNFEYTKVENTLYGFCKVFESYFLIQLNFMNNIYFLKRIINHCGPTDVEIFSNKKYINYHNNEPIIRNSDRIFLFHRGETIYTQSNFLLTGVSNTIIYNNYFNQKNNKQITRIGNVMSITEEYIMINNVVYTVDECFNSINNSITNDEYSKIFLIILKDNIECSLIDIVNKIKTRKCTIQYLEISKNIVIVTTRIRNDSFILNLNKVMTLNGNYKIYENYLCIPFDNVTNAEIFGRFLC